MLFPSYKQFKESAVYEHLKEKYENSCVHGWLVLKHHRSRSTVKSLMWPFFVFSGVTGLVSTDEKNARNIDVDLWAMTNQETGEYGVSHGFIVSLRVLKVILAAHEDVNL